jgi:hypothetical protein
MLNAEEIVTAWWRHVVEQDDDPPRNRKELEDKVIRCFANTSTTQMAPDLRRCQNGPHPVRDAGRRG